MVDKWKCPYSAVYESNEALCVDVLLRQLWPLWLYGLVVAFSCKRGVVADCCSSCAAIFARLLSEGAVAV